MSPGPAPADGLADGGAPVADLEHLGRSPRRPGEEAARIARRVLGARVVVGDDQDVGQARRDLAHHRALAGVAVAARAEHDEQPPAVSGRRAAQRGRDRVGLVGVVDDDREVLALVDPLQAAGDPGAARASAAATAPASKPASRAGGDRGQRVGHVEVAGQRDARVDVEPSGPRTVKREPVGSELDVDRPPVAPRRRRREGPHRDRGLVDQPAAVLVVDVDQAAPGALGREQRRLGGEVVLHVARGSRGGRGRGW